MNDLISRKALIAEYDRVHIGPPGGARKLMEDAPSVNIADVPHWATEEAYKNGYEQGKKDAADNNVGRKWISVKDRLPEPFVSVLVQMPGEKPFPTVREGFISKEGIWHSALYDREPDEVTHWQPMPQPPKGE